MIALTHFDDNNDMVLVVYWLWFYDNFRTFVVVQKNLIIDELIKLAL